MALSHPNIAQIYGFEESGDQKFLVLEYVQGETLAPRLKRGPIPVDEALNIWMVCIKANHLGGTARSTAGTDR